MSSCYPDNLLIMFNILNPNGNKVSETKQINVINIIQQLTQFVKFKCTKINNLQKIYVLTSIYNINETSSTFFIENISRESTKLILIAL